MPKFLVTKLLYVSRVVDAPDEDAAVRMAREPSSVDAWEADDPQPRLSEDEINVCAVED